MTPEENEYLTSIGPGTRMGALMRRYWHPVAGASEMEKRATMPVRILGEDLVLFKNKTGKLGLIKSSCPHRRASLLYGIPTEDGIRCPYHGWEFNAEGRCIDQPNETERHALNKQIATKAYPVEELGGLIFTYMGPQPAPLLPRFDLYLQKHAIRSIGKAVIPCNWLQIMENSADPIHTEWLHGHFFEYQRSEAGDKTPLSRRHLKIGFEEYEFGLMKRRLREGQSEDTDDWKVGHPLIFPNIVSVGFTSKGWGLRAFQIRVPADDTHTLHFWYQVYLPSETVEVPDHLTSKAPVFEIPLKDENGQFNLNWVDTQDAMVWVTQGAIYDRTTETLGATDRGVVMYRKMLKREEERSRLGQDPMGLVRDPERNEEIAVPVERHNNIAQGVGFVEFLKTNTDSLSPIADELFDLIRRSGPSQAAKQPAPAPAK